MYVLTELSVSWEGNSASCKSIVGNQYGINRMDKLTKDAVFLFEVLDDGALFPVYPSRHCDDQDMP